MKEALLGLVALLAAGVLPAVAAQQAASGQVDFQQKLGSRLPLQSGFRDEHGVQVRLGDYFDGKLPVALVFAYYECPNLCDVTLAGVFEGLAKSGYTAGEDFRLVVIGIDPKETPAQAADQKQELMARAPVAGAERHAHLLTGERHAIQAATEAVGFGYRYDAASEQYVHPAGMVVATPEGVVSRYLFGVRYRPTDIRLAMVEASDHRVGSLTDKLLLLCSQYDPATGRYGVVIMSVLRLSGGAAVLALGLFIWRSVRRERRHSPGGAEAGP